jgi:hypothetical protein
MIFKLSASRIFVAAAATFTLSGLSSAKAQLIASDEFDYSSSNLDGQGGGVGWGDTWGGGSANFSITSGLTYSSLQTLGNAVTGGGQTYRTLSAPVASSGSVYVAFLLNQSSANYANVGVFSGSTELVSIGDTYTGSGPSSTYSFNASSNVPGAGGGVYVSSGVSIDTTSTQLLVLEIDNSNPLQTSFYMYLNPAIGGAAPLQSTAVASFVATAGGFTFDRVRIEDAGGTIDELRIGSDFASVTPVPEPTTMGLLLMAGGGAAMAIRRRKLGR